MLCSVRNIVCSFSILYHNYSSKLVICQDQSIVQVTRRNTSCHSYILVQVPIPHFRVESGKSVQELSSFMAQLWRGIKEVQQIFLKVLGVSIESQKLRLGTFLLPRRYCNFRRYTPRRPIAKVFYNTHSFVYKIAMLELSCYT